jgi:hypothetical protein
MVCGNVDIRQPIINDIAGGHPATVIIIEVIEDIEFGVFLECVDKVHMRP